MRNLVDNTDWLKTAAIIFVSADHLGFFFIDNDLWWRVFGRFAAPPFFFLVGYAQSRTVPLHWIGIGVILTLLESWNADWTWVSPNILLSFVLIRIARPYVDTLLQNHGWVAFIVVVSVLLALLPIATKIVDYGAEGWLWALFGLCQRRYLDGISAVRATGGTRGSPAPTLTATDNRWPDAPFGLLARCGGLRLAGARGGLVSGSSFGRRYSGSRRLVDQPVSLQTRREPLPTPREDS
jgi:hypothetical protein